MKKMSKHCTIILFPFSTPGSFTKLFLKIIFITRRRFVILRSFSNISLFNNIRISSITCITSNTERYPLHTTHPHIWICFLIGCIYITLFSHSFLNINFQFRYLDHFVYLMYDVVCWIWIILTTPDPTSHDF